MTLKCCQCGLHTSVVISALVDEKIDEVANCNYFLLKPLFMSISLFLLLSCLSLFFFSWLRWI